MNTRIIPLIAILLLIVLAGPILSACASSRTSASTSAPTLNSSLNGQTIMQQQCSRCHSLNRVKSAHHTAAEWQITVNRMINKGAQLNQQEEQALIDYLAQNYK
jgi:cytochrome c2